MKKKYVIIIMIGIILVISVYFGYKGFYLYGYSLNSRTIENYEEYYSSLSEKSDLNIKTSEVEDYLTFKGIKIKNDWKNNIEITDENDFSTIYKIHDDEGVDKGTIWLGVENESIIETFKNDKDYKTSELIRKNNIESMKDLIDYLIKNKDKKMSIFTPVKEMESWHTINLVTASLYGNIKSITYLNGDLDGVMFETENNSKIVSIYKDDKYYFIHFYKLDYFTEDYIKELLNTIVIENKVNELTEKTCVHTNTYRFLDYYDFEGTVPTDYFIVLDVFQKFEPFILKLNSSKFPKNFTKNEYYEITFRETKYPIKSTDGISYSTKTEILKVEQTEKQGLDQTQESCILK